jgi:hypothetical protein
VASGGEIIPRVYTRSGDRGTTGLAGGTRVSKDSDRIRAYGTYDELGAQLGVALVEISDDLPEIREVVVRLGHELFVAQAELAARARRRAIRSLPTTSSGSSATSTASRRFFRPCTRSWFRADRARRPTCTSAVRSRAAPNAISSGSTRPSRSVPSSSRGRIG